MGIEVAAECVTGSRAPLPTVMEVGKRRGAEWGKLPGALVMWEEAPVSMYHSLELGGGWVLMQADASAE